MHWWGVFILSSIIIAYNVLIKIKVSDSWYDLVVKGQGNTYLKPVNCSKCKYFDLDLWIICHSSDLKPLMVSTYFGNKCAKYIIFIETTSSKGYSLYKFKYFWIFFSFKYLTFDWKTESFLSSTYLRQTLLHIWISSIEKVRGVALEAKQPDNIHVFIKLICIHRTSIKDYRSSCCEP